MGLLGLIGSIEEKPATQLLGMNETAPVPGLYCILDKDLGKVEENIHRGIARQLDTHMKFKMYGEQELDLSIAQLAWSILGKDSFILSDANRGYKGWKSIDELAQILIALRNNGLNAMEDPAELSIPQWEELQSKVGSLDLAPDYPLRPAWEGAHRITKGMGRIYNLHPESMGSFHHLRPLVEKVKGFGGKLMIGDASLVGPGCSIWQQIAIGVGAAWVEAIEKEADSEAYLACLGSQPTFRDENGLFAYSPRPGFGIEIDEKMLREACPVHYTIE